MKFFLALVLLFGSFLAQAKTVANYTYLKAKKPVKKTISFEEVKTAYGVVQQSAFNAPKPKDFFQDYLRFKMGVEVALNERKLVRNPNILRQIVNPYLKQAVEQELYKALAEQRLRSEMEKLDKTSANLSSRKLKSLYAESPEFNIFYIAINHPINPTAKQIQEAKQRAQKVHAQVVKSKKPFLELVALYSDDKTNGTLGINRSRASILPEVYPELKKMKNGQISRPIQTSSGFYIVTLNRRVPFSEANQVAIKANYFNKERSNIFNNYFNGLKKDFKVNEFNQALIQTL